MRILHVADFVSEKTGYQDFVLPKYHARHGHEVHVVTSNWNPPAPNYAASLEPFLGSRVMEQGTYVVHGVTIHRLAVCLEKRNRVILSRLGDTCRAIRPDVIFVHDTMTPTALRMVGVARKIGVPVYFDNHSIFSVQNKSLPSRIVYAIFRQVMARYVAPRAAGFFGVANECVDFLVKAQGVPPEKVELLPLGVDTDLFRPDPEGGREWRRANAIEDSAFVVVQTGKLDPAKDPLTLARAVKRLKVDPARPLHLVYVGAGPPPYVQTLVQTVRKATAHRVTVLPPVEVGHLSAVFSGSDVVCYPGGTSMSSLEAAACGRLVIMNDEAVSSWRSKLGIGVTFREGDPISLSNRLEEIRKLESADRALREEAALQSAVREFSYERISLALEARMESDRQVAR